MTQDWKVRFRKLWASVNKENQHLTTERIENLIESLLKAERNAALSEAIALSDLIESQNNTVFDEWRAFKQFRNTLRDKLKHE